MAHRQPDPTRITPRFVILTILGTLAVVGAYTLSPIAEPTTTCTTTTDHTIPESTCK